jgi:hypothetical protein
MVTTKGILLRRCLKCYQELTYDELIFVNRIGSKIYRMCFYCGCIGLTADFPRV